MFHPDKEILQSSFKLGYVLTLINHEIEEIQNSFGKKDNLWEFLSIFVKNFENDYKITLGEELVLFPDYRSTDDIRDYFMGLFESVKSVLNNSHNPYTEITFLIGGIVAISYNTDDEKGKKDKLKTILCEMMQIIDPSYSREEIFILIDRLNSFDLQERLESRIKLFSKFDQTLLGSEKIEALDYLDTMILGAR